MTKELNFKKYAGVSVKITKQSDEVFNGAHPNGINPGYVNEGVVSVTASIVYGCLFLENGFHTSEIQSIEEFEGYDIVKTRNSTYKVELNVSAIPGVQEKYNIGETPEVGTGIKITSIEEL